MLHLLPSLVLVLETGHSLGGDDEFRTSPALQPEAVPDVAFALDDMQYHQLARRFEQERALWSASDSIHLIVIATLGISAAGLPHIAALRLMPVTAQWLPVETIAEQQLVESLVRERRAFSKVLRYNLSSDTRIACIALTDRGPPAPLLFAGGADFPPQP